MGEKVVLAYSGGLDTSVILKWLMEEGYSVICYVANVGQDEDFDAVERKALQLGAATVFVEDLRQEFVTDFIFPAVQANALYESRYLLGTALARPCIARRQVEIAIREGARHVAHGATGKGNDQVRFELTFYALAPHLRVIAPWRDDRFLARFKGRTDLLNYARERGVAMPSGNRPPYSMDENLMHISYESGELEDPKTAPREAMYRRTEHFRRWPDEPEAVRIDFRDGRPVSAGGVDSPGGARVGHTYDRPLSLFELLNAVARRHGIGRVDIVENRFVGIKSRGVYETPGMTILRCAHLDIEGIAMDREVMRLRDMLSPKFAELVYNGFWFSPESDFLLAAISKSQELIDGWVDVLCYKGGCMAVARDSPSSLYSEKIASMESVDGYDPSDASGFIRINAIRLRAHREILQSVDHARLRSRPVGLSTYTALEPRDDADAGGDAADAKRGLPPS